MSKDFFVADTGGEPLNMSNDNAYRLFELVGHPLPGPVGDLDPLEWFPRFLNADLTFMSPYFVGRWHQMLKLFDAAHKHATEVTYG
jgi:hypothetical protein